LSSLDRDEEPVHEKYVTSEKPKRIKKGHLPEGN
jgi:hypothetical protein